MAVVFDSVGFSAELDSLKKKVSDKLKAQLKTVATEEAQSQLDDKSPNDAQAYTRFCDKITVRNGVKKVDKSIIPEDVYKTIMLEAAVRDATISNGFKIGNLDSKTVSAIASWFQGIFGKKTMTVGKYKVTMQSNYSAQVTSPSGSVYSLAWTLDDTAKKALKAYIADLKTYLSDYRYQIYGEIIKDGLSPLINEFIAEVAEGVDSAREKLINNFHEWALNKAADVAIDKILPKTYKQIKAVAKNYKTFVSKLNDLKTYAKTVKDDSIISNKKYTAFVTAYNNLGIGNYVDVVANYLSYEFLETVGGVFGQNKALITGTASDNKISASGSYVTIKGGGGDDFISASGPKSRILGDAGNDKVLLESSQGSISGGAGSDSIIVDGEHNTVLGGANDDYIALFKDKNTITGGTGNDSIFFVGVGESVIKYNSGDGNDTIIGYDATDTIKITGNYSTQTSRQDVIITVGNGSIRLVGASGKQININNTNKVISKFTSGEATNYTLPSFYGEANYVKYGTNGDDTNWGGYYWSSNITSNVVINMLAGNDIISNSYAYINNRYYSGDKVTINADSGDDYVENYCLNVLINGGSDNDSISNEGDHVTIYGGSGNDSISISTKKVWNSQNSEYETITGNDVVMNGGDGDDTISNSYQKTTYGQSYGGDNFIVDGGKGNDSITNYGNNASLYGGNGNDTISNGGDSVIIDGGAGNDFIENSGKDVSINSGAGNDSIDNWSNGDSVTIDSGTGNDIISNSSDNSSIQSGAGNDLIDNRGDNSTIDAGMGNDFIRNIAKGSHSSKISISGGAGNDSIYSNHIYYNGYYYDGGSDVTIDGGSGNDLITINKYDSRNNLIEYKSGNGNDTIIGFNETSTLSIAGGGYVTTSGEDVIIKSGSGSVLLSDARLNETLNIIFSDGSDTNGILSVEGSAKSDNIINKRNNSTINALGGDDSVSNNAANVLIFGGKNNDIISNDGEKVLIFGETGNDLIRNSGKYTTINGDEGKDTIENKGNNVTVLGGASNDSILSEADKVSIFSGAGNDSIKIFGNNITVDGGTDNDYISTATKIVRENDKYETITSNNVFMNGGSGNDTIYNEYGSNITVDGGDGNDLISLGSGSNNEIIKYSSGDGNDSIVGFKENSTISISGGTYSQYTFFNDVILTVGKGKITLQGAAKLGTLKIRGKEDPNSPGRNFILGTAGNDSIYNTVEGATINALGGDDSVKNGDGYYTNGKSKVSINTGNGNDKIYNYDNGIDSTILCGSGNDYVWNKGANVLLDGGKGNDTLNNYFYCDKSTIDGGSGNDYIDNVRSTNVSINAGAGNDTIDNSGSYEESFVTIEGGAGNDSITNRYADNVLIDAGSGNDTIHNDHSDNSTISAGAGNDSILIDNQGAYDIIDAGSGNDYIQNGSKLAAGHYLKIIGGSGNDTIKNGGTYVTIEGGKGDDVISLDDHWSSKETVKYTLGDGNDTIYNFDRYRTLSIAGAKYSTKKSGSDVVVTVGKGKIILDGAASLNSVNIDFILTVNDKTSSPMTVGSSIQGIEASERTTAVKITGNSKTNTISGGSARDTISGGEGNDSLVGNAGNDKLYGGNGNDTLWGGVGNDSLWGDTGADTFIYGAGDGKDVIFGFDNKDTLTLDGLDFSASYSKKTGTLTFKVDGDSIILKDLGTTTTFHINNDIYKISGSKLIKK